MVLEEHVVLVGNAADSAEDIATHKVVGVGAKAINDLAGC